MILLLCENTHHHNIIIDRIGLLDDLRRDLSAANYKVN